MSEYVYDSADVEALLKWWTGLPISAACALSGASCAVAHFKKGEDGAWIPLPQCTDMDVVFPDGSKEELYDGDTLVWDGDTLSLERTGIGHNPRSYRESLRIR